MFYLDLAAYICELPNRFVRNRLKELTSKTVLRSNYQHDVLYSVSNWHWFYLINVSDCHVRRVKVSSSMDGTTILAEFWKMENLSFIGKV